METNHLTHLNNNLLSQLSFKSNIKEMECYFLKYREGVCGLNYIYSGNVSKTQKIIYSDWAAMGKNYIPIEHQIQTEIMPFLSNIDGKFNITRVASTYAHRTAQQAIKKHVNASKDDVIVTAYSGTTRMIKRFQQILGFNPLCKTCLNTIVFVTHMEHYSNKISWESCGLTVRVIKTDASGLVDLNHLQYLLERYNHIPIKLASVTSCSNVTGIITPYYSIAKMMHRANGYCFVDFACSAPYVTIDMHPSEEEAQLDAIFFSPHKFLGGPGSSSVLVFNKELYNLNNYDHSKIQANKLSVEHIENYEDDGSPAILQTIKAALAIQLKEKMGVDNIAVREYQLLNILWKSLIGLPGLNILAPNHKDRLGILSFFIDSLPATKVSRILNLQFGIQCKAGKIAQNDYVHKLLYNQNPLALEELKQLGWVRISIHPVMTIQEIRFIGESIATVVEQCHKWTTIDQQKIFPEVFKEKIDTLFAL